MFFIFPVIGESDIFPQIFKNNFSLVRSAHLSPAASSGLKLHQVPSASPAHLPSNLTPCFPSTHLHLSFDCSKYSTLPKCFHFPLSWYLATQLPTGQGCLLNPKVRGAFLTSICHGTRLSTHCY